MAKLSRPLWRRLYQPVASRAVVGFGSVGGDVAPAGYGFLFLKIKALAVADKRLVMETSNG